MQRLSSHVTRTLIAGAVALLPVGGLVLGIAFAEDSISESWLADQPYYFPGMGLVAVAAITYAIGLGVTTLVGRVLWRLVDDLLARLPALGMLYRTMKQILGYGEGEDALFEHVVLVPGRDSDAFEVGLVTKTLPAEGEVGARLVVFVPAAPTPTTGRVVVIEAARTQRLAMSVHDAMKFLVAAGKFEGGELTPQPQV